MDAQTQTVKRLGWWQPVVFASLAGGMGWGIRGQYGHETGAMIAGLLVSLVLTYLLCPNAASLSWARAVAFCTIAMGFGGTMTYGQTIGLTQDVPLQGVWMALRWGFFGLAVKGGIWIGFAGVFLGMGLGGVRYRARDLLGLLLAMLGAYYIGVRLLNEPFHPAQHELPLLYFSDSWLWEPDGDLSPRREAWGGLLFALITVFVYTSRWRRDRLARNLCFWGCLGGAIGFPLGQSLQAFHAWNPGVFERGLWTHLDPYMNWWNMMEITFGATMGAALGFGLWLNRSRIRLPDDPETGELSLGAEALLLGVHVPMLVAVEFAAIAQVDALYDLGLILGILPLVAVAGGRWWPYLVPLPLILIPIAGKTLRQLAYREEAISVPLGATIYVVIPLVLALVYAIRLSGRAPERRIGRVVVGRVLLFSVWMYFLLNFAVFRYPWPWADWTGRTPSGILFGVCVVAITAMVVATTRTKGRELQAGPDSGM